MFLATEPIAPPPLRLGGRAIPFPSPERIFAFGVFLFGSGLYHALNVAFDAEEGALGREARRGVPARLGQQVLPHTLPALFFVRLHNPSIAHVMA